MKRIAHDIPAATYDGKRFTLRAVNMPRKQAQPLILWEGFYQNGLFFDLESGRGSIAEFMVNSGYDVWIVNSRGNGGSTGQGFGASMDDFAALDIPAAISYVAAATGMAPIFAGHSQGGNTALMSMMGAVKSPSGEVSLSDEEAARRQGSLKGLVTLGSYLDFTFSGASSLQNFVKQGVILTLFGRKFHLVRSTTILNLLKIFTRLPVPVPQPLRDNMTRSRALRILLFPLTGILNFVSLMQTWSFLYHIPNATRRARILLFYRTMQATYWGILAQYQRAIMEGRMTSSDGRVNYSDNYGRVALPISVVTMEYDTLADPGETERVMFPKLGSARKFYAEWMGQGHEDFVMNPAYFHQLADAVARLEVQKP